jgi:hypothetical protein
MTRRWHRPIVALIVLVGALALSAAAQGFTVTKLGKGKMVASSAQLFKTTAGTIECKKASAGLEFIVHTFEALEAPKLQYSECTGLGTTASVTPASESFNQLGSMQLTKTMTIEPEAAGCSFVFERATEETVSYSINAGGRLVLDLDVSGLPYSATGGECGGSGKAKYTGVLEAEDTGGEFVR